MTELSGLAFAAIITITLPDSDEATELKVILWPSDSINQAEGSVKPLQDCTLGELLQFADNLENEIWSTFREFNLLDLVIQGGAEIDFEIKKGAENEPDTEQFWLEHLLIIEPSQPDIAKLEGSPKEEEGRLTPGSDYEKDLPVGETADKPPIEEGEKVVELGLEDQKQDADWEAIVDDIGAEPVVSQPEIDTAPTDELAQELAEPDTLEKEETEISEKEGETAKDLAELQLAEAEGEALTEEPTSEEIIAESKPIEIEERPRIRILGRRRPLNHPTWTSVDILVNESAFRNTQAHALSRLDREVAGVLVGPPPEKQPDGRYLVHVSDTIIAKYTRMHGASVTYTPESWRYVNDKLAEMYPDNQAVIIGWYHTHPGFGIFLSGMDQFIHRNFFTQIWHIALVLDPLARRTGFFCWDREQSKVDRYEFPWPNWARNSW